MDFLVLIAIQVALSLLYLWLAPDTKPTDTPGDFRPPAPREGEPIPVVFGTCKVSPSVTWFGDVEAKRVIKKESTLFGLVSTDIPLGWEYFAGMQLVICHGPIDRLLDIHIGEYQVKRRKAVRRDGASTGSTAVPSNYPYVSNPSVPFDQSATGDPTPFYINLPDLFGGDEEGGGIVGRMDIHWGTENQGQNDYLAVWWGADILPQYRGVTYMVLRRMNMGKSPSPQPWQFVVERIPDVLGQSAFATIVDADGNNTANVAECIYEILTNDRWGVAMDPDDIDIATFQAAGQTLFNEGLGYNGQIIATGAAWGSIRTALGHINGVLYQDPTTGLLGLKLVRDDYDILTVPEFNESNCSLDEFRRGSWAEIVNETAVKYLDIGRRFSEGVAQAQNLAAIQAMGEVVTNTIELPGLSTHELAQIAASRSNRATSVPITRGRLRTTRYGYNLHQGSVFKIDFPHFGISGLPCRVTRINYGSLTEGTMEIEFVEDPFNSINPYASPSDYVDNTICGPLALALTGYDPSDDPAADFGDGVVYAMEVPYWHLESTDRKFWGFCSKTSNQDLYWVPYVARHGSDYERITRVYAYNALGVLDADLDLTTIATVASLTIRNLGSMEDLTSTDAAGRVAGERLAIIISGDQEEIIAWESVTDNGDGSYTFTNVMRGVLDTVPLNHYAGASVLFYWNNYPTDLGAPNAYDILSSVVFSDESLIGLRAARVDQQGAEREASTVRASEVVLSDRAAAPYPPGKVTLNSNEYDAWPTSTSGDVTLGWTHRSRVNQTTIVAQDDATAYTLEGTIDVEVLIGGSVVRSFTGLTGTSQAYTYAQRTADDADLTKKVQFRITPKGASGEVGFPRVTPAFTMNA